MNPTGTTTFNGTTMGTAMANYLQQNPSVANQSLTPVPQPSSAAVVNSKSATADIGNIQTQHQGIVQGMQTQANNVATNNANKNTSLTTNANPTTIANTTPAVVPTYGSDVKDASGNVIGQAKFDPNTGQPLQQNTQTTQSSTDQNSQVLNDSQTQLNNLLNDYQSQSDKVTQAIGDIQNGVMPLNAGEQAQIAGLQQQFGSLITQQVQQNTAADGTANIRGYQTGAAEYDPSFQVKTIGSIVTAGLNKVADLNVQMASAVANLTQSFKDNDIKAVKDAWDMYSQTADKRQAALQKTIDDTTASIKDARDFAASQAKEAFSENLESEKFDYSKSQDQIDNMFKSQQITETERHDMTDEANQKATIAIEQNRARIENAEFNVSYGQFLNKDGSVNTNIDPTQIPGYTQLPNGMPVVSNVNGIYKVPSVGGIPVVSQSAIQTATASAANAKTVSQMQVLYNTIASGDSGGSAEKNQYTSLYNSLPKDVQSQLPSVGFFTSAAFDNPSKSTGKFTTAYTSLNTSISSAIPGSNPPVYGQTFNDIDSLNSFLGKTSQGNSYDSAYSSLSNVLGRTPTTGEMLQYFNGQ